MQQLREEHDKVLNSTKDNVTTETIEELYKLIQTLEDKKLMIRKLVRSKTCLWIKYKALQHNFNEERGKSEKGAKTIQVLQKDLKLSKAARKSAEVQLI